MLKNRKNLNIFLGAIAATLAFAVSIPSTGSFSLTTSASAGMRGERGSMFDNMRLRQTIRAEQDRLRRIRDFERRNDARRAAIRAARAARAANRAARRAARNAARDARRAARRAERDRRRARLWALNGRVYTPQPDYAYNHSNGRLSVGVAPRTRWVMPDNRFSFSR